MMIKSLLLPKCILGFLVACQTMTIIYLSRECHELQNNINEKLMQHHSMGTTTTKEKRKDDNDVKKEQEIIEEDNQDGKAEADTNNVVPPVTNAEMTIKSIMQQKNIVGTFNQYPITFELFSPSPKNEGKGQQPKDTTTVNSGSEQQHTKKKKFQSSVQCVGDNFDVDDTSWMYRSCDFHNLCFDLIEKDFVYVVDDSENKLQDNNNLQTLIQQYNEPAQRMRAKLAQENNYTLRFLHDVVRGFLPPTSTIVQDYHLHRLQNIKDPISISITSSSPPKYVSLGGLNPNWTNNPTTGYPLLKWFPRKISFDEMQQTSYSSQDKEDGVGYFMLPKNAVLIPFHSFGAINVGHLLWDDFLPLYTLLSIFGYTNDDNGTKEQGKESWDDDQSKTPTDERTAPYLPILIRYGILPGRQDALWASCESSSTNYSRCQKLWTKFLIAMGVPSWDHMSTPLDVKLTLHDSFSKEKPKGRYVCSRHAVAGMGMLTDHGLKKHGWEPEDYRIVHNVGRGPSFYQFRTFLMTNMGYTSNDIYYNVLRGGSESFSGLSSNVASTNPMSSQRRFSPPIKIVVSRFSSRGLIRNIDFQPEIDALLHEFGADGNPTTDERSAFNNNYDYDPRCHLGWNSDNDDGHSEVTGTTSHVKDDIFVCPKIFTTMNSTEQVDAVKDASIMITVAGGGAVTSMFLPRGASLIVYYDEESVETKEDERSSNPTTITTLPPPVISGHLDWDYLNNLGYLRVHWLPLRRLRGEEETTDGSSTTKSTSLLIDLIKTELEHIELHRRMKER